MKTRGFTLIEMLVVVTILAALACIVVPLIDGMYTSNAGKVTAATLVEIRNAILGKGAQSGFVNDVGNWRGKTTVTLPSGLAVTPGSLPLHLHDLLSSDHLPSGKQTFDINTHIGWRGPYLRSTSATYQNSVTASATFSADYCYNNTDFVIIDEWNHAIVLQYINYSGTTPSPDDPVARLISAGSNGVIDTLPTDLIIDPKVNDDIILNLKRATN